MDGNRRWAAERGLPAFMGHRQGVETVITASKFCVERAIPYLSLYAFSLENFKRSAQEQEYLFALVAQHLVTVSHELQAHKVRLRFVGDRTLFPACLQESIHRVEQETAAHTALHVDILFCYGGQQEIVAAAQQFARTVQQGASIEALTPAGFAQLLWNAPTPPPDLVIRTGGQQRLSNFLLFQSAYAELYFTNTFWPAFTREELATIVDQYLHRTRNFGA